MLILGLLLLVVIGGLGACLYLLGFRLGADEPAGRVHLGSASNRRSTTSAQATDEGRHLRND